MRVAGIQKTRDLPVEYIAGNATSISLRSASCDAAWLSTVIHHIPDLDACARELRRVLHLSAPVLIRGAFPGRASGITLFRYFPEAASVVETYPTVEATVSAFERAGFSYQSLEPVPQQSVASLAEFRARVAHRADTTLKLIPGAAFEEGLRRLDDAIARGEHDGPVVDYLDLLVLR
jgi:ubiquinone/menaquinone biosynthesis C-methylase UbiE